MAIEAVPLAADFLAEYEKKDKSATKRLWNKNFFFAVRPTSRGTWTAVISGEKDGELKVLAQETGLRTPYMSGGLLSLACELFEEEVESGS